MARRHIMFFTSALGGGGAEKHLVRLANHLDPDRFRVSIAVARGGGSYEREVSDSVSLHSLGASKMPYALSPLRTLLRRERPDLLCSMLDHANCVALAAALTIPDRMPVVAGVQVPPSIHYTRGHRLRGRVILAAARRLYPHADRIVAISRGVAEDLERVVPAAGSRIRVIYNAGFDDSTIRAAEKLVPYRRNETEPIIIAVGRLTEQKGYPDLLRAFARVRGRMGARLWIAGEGEMRDQLEDLAEQLGIRASIDFLGFIENPYAYMRAADVFVLPSLWEGFGNVIVEAMAVGTPVVVVDCPHGPAEIVEGGKRGVLVAPGDPAGLSKGIESLLRDRELRQSMAEQGQERARSFSAEHIAGQYGELFEEVLEEADSVSSSEISY